MGSNEALRDFLELEGLPQVLDEKILFSVAASSRGHENAKDDEIRPNSAYSLTNAEVYAEMEKYGIKSTGFVDTDRAVLQRVFDEELERDMAIIIEKKKKEKLETIKHNIVNQRVDAMHSSVEAEKQIRNDSNDIIGYIAQNRTNQCMRLYFNSIESRVLAKCLWLNSNLLVLDLSDNDISDHSCSYLARSLIRNSSLRDLNLSHNRAATLTCRAFSESLLVNSSLKVLDLSDNPIGSLSTREIDIDKPQANFTLGMEIGVEVSEPVIFSRFCNALAANNGLVTLLLKNIGLSSKQEEGEVLISNLRQNTAIFDVNTAFNRLTLSQEAAVVDILTRNRSRTREIREGEFKLAFKNIEYETHQRSLIETQKKASSKASYLDDRRNERAIDWSSKGEEDQAQAKEVMLKQRQKDIDKMTSLAAEKKTAEVNAAAKAAKKKK